MISRANFWAFLGVTLQGVAAAPGRLRIVTYRDARTERFRRFGLTESSAGCHTLLIDHYIVEGHVPLGVVGALLRERPRVRGITLPGMPTGVAGMPGPKLQTYRIMTLETRPRVFASV